MQGTNILLNVSGNTLLLVAETGVWACPGLDKQVCPFQDRDCGICVSCSSSPCLYYTRRTMLIRSKDQFPFVLRRLKIALVVEYKSPIPVQFLSAELKPERLREDQYYESTP
jgi:hypothetical protein